MTDPTPPPGPANPWPSDTHEAAGPWASDHRSPAMPAATQPPSIVTAVKLMYVGAGLTALGILVSFLQIDALRDAIEDNDSSLSDSEVDTAVAGTLAVSVIAGLIIIGLWVWMAYANGRGRSWARIVSTILGGLNIVFTLLNLASGNSTPIGLVVALIGLGLAGYILYLMWRPESTAFYEANSPR